MTGHSVRFVDHEEFLIRKQQLPVKFLLFMLPFEFAVADCAGAIAGLSVWKIECNSRFKPFSRCNTSAFPTVSDLLYMIYRPPAGVRDRSGALVYKGHRSDFRLLKVEPTEDPTTCCI